MAVCSICLRTNLTVNTVNQALVSLYDDLLENEIFPNLSFCVKCEQLLKRCYNFKQLCQKSNQILQDWKKKKKTEISIENLHSLIQLYYDEYLETNYYETQNKSESDINIVQTNNENSFDFNYNDNLIEYIEDGIEYDNEVDIKDVIRNNKDLFQSNNILTETIEENFHIELEEGLNLSDNECDEIGYSSDNERNGTGYNNDDVDNGIVDYSDNEDDDSDFNGTDDDSSGSEDLESIRKLLEDLKRKNVEIQQQNEQMKINQNQNIINDIGNSNEIKNGIKQGGKLSQNMEKYESVFDIVLFESKEEAKAEFMERPNSDYYKNATTKCNICYSVFRWPKLLDYHLKWHSPSAGDHICKICEMRFPASRTLRRHKSNCHAGRYTCKMCPLVTYGTETMMRHFDYHLGVEHKCKICDRKFNHITTYMTHMRKFHHKSQHVCSLCAGTFISAQGLNQHRLFVHQGTEDVETESSVKCEVCNIMFANQDVYLVHIKNTHTHKDMVLCPCGQQFENRKAMAAHKRQEHPLSRKKKDQNEKEDQKEKKVYTCEECGAKSESLKSLYHHYRREHTDLPYPSEKPYLCDQCGASYKLRCQLMKHVRMHTGERPFVCGDCGRAFSNKVRLYLHSEWHKPPSRACHICGKNFVSASNLGQHMRGHIGDRRYKCSVCGKGFLHGATLREHVRGVHQNVKRVRKQRQQIPTTNTKRIVESRY